MDFGVKLINCCLRTEYHRLAVPDKSQRVLPVCFKRVGVLNLITQALSNLWGSEFERGG
jgi:hypothetical protein